jgi:hypothetical protein
MGTWVPEHKAYPEGPPPNGICIKNPHYDRLNQSPKARAIPARRPKARAVAADIMPSLAISSRINAKQ